MSTTFGFSGNRYEDEVRDIAAFLLIKGGASLYTFFHQNLHLPEISTIRTYLNSQKSFIQDGEIYFDALKDYLVKNDLSFDVGVYEDGTRVNILNSILFFCLF